jgi:hypothetical protein
MQMRLAIMSAVFVMAGAGQVTEQAQGPLFWVTSVRNSPAAPDRTPPFEFHWGAGANQASSPEKLESYLVIVHYFGSREENKADSARWAGFNFPGTIRSLPEGLGAEPAFGPGAGPGPIDHYMFEFYALDTRMELPVETASRDLMRAMGGHIVGKATWWDRAAGGSR